MNLTSLPEDCSLQDIHSHLFYVLKNRNCISKSAVTDEHARPASPKPEGKGCAGPSRCPCHSESALALRNLLLRKAL
jgi:hypothetical protein